MTSLDRAAMDHIEGRRQAPATLSPATATGGAAPDREPKISTVGKMDDSEMGGAGEGDALRKPVPPLVDDGRIAPDLDIPARLRRTA
jgi:hypothetical protein